MKILIIPGFLGHPNEKVFAELIETLKVKNYDVEIVSWPNFPSNLSKYNFTNTLDHIRELLKVSSNEELVILGFSMGGILASVIASEFKPKKIGFIVSPFQAGTDDDLEGRYKEWKVDGYRIVNSSVHGDLKIPFSFINDARKYNALDYIGKIICPKLFLVAEADEKVTRKASDQLYAVAKEPKEWHLIPKAKHRYQYQEGKIEIANKIIIDFIEINK
jgi:esterase/lipase